MTWQLQKGRYYGACQRRNPACKVKKTIREDRLEETIQTLLNDLVCPSQELIDWVAQQLETRRETTSQAHEDTLESINRQIDRLVRMGSDLYDDKLAGDITKDVYQTKHTTFMEQLNELRSKQGAIEDKVNKNDLPQRLALLKLTQMAAKLYQTRTVDQKRVILTKLFSSFTYSDGVVSVKYSKFASVIANKTLKTKEILGRWKMNDITTNNNESQDDNQKTTPVTESFLEPNNSSILLPGVIFSTWLGIMDVFQKDNTINYSKLLLHIVQF